MFTLVCHPLEAVNKINNADHILITLQFPSLSKSNARELTITLGFQSTIERADNLPLGVYHHIYGLKLCLKNPLLTCIRKTKFPTIYLMIYLPK